MKGRYREPYNARHSFVIWNLMLGKNLLWVAKQQEDVEAIRRALGARPLPLLTGPATASLTVP